MKKSFIGVVSSHNCWLAIGVLSTVVSYSEIVSANEERLTVASAKQRVKQFIECERRTDIKIEDPFLMGSYWLFPSYGPNGK